MLTFSWSLGIRTSPNRRPVLFSWARDGIGQGKGANGSWDTLRVSTLEITVQWFLLYADINTIQSLPCLITIHTFVQPTKHLSLCSYIKLLITCWTTNHSWMYAVMQCMCVCVYVCVCVCVCVCVYYCSVTMICLKGYSQWLENAVVDWDLFGL